MKSKQFEKQLKQYFSTYTNQKLVECWYHDKLHQLGKKDDIYQQWLFQIDSFLKKKLGIKSASILDVGCGFGILTVQLGLLNNRVIGIDLDEKYLQLAYILKKENNVEGLFLKYNGNRIPIKDKSINIITLFSCVEHMDDLTLNKLIQELHRICKGIVYIIVPNKWKIYDDHVNLYWLPLLPRKLALLYIKLRGKDFYFEISHKKEWDVYYRSYFKIKKLFEPFFEIYHVPPLLSFPPPHITSMTTKFNDFLVKYTGINRNIFNPTLNLIFIPK